MCILKLFLAYNRLNTSESQHDKVIPSNSRYCIIDSFGHVSELDLSGFLSKLFYTPFLFYQPSCPHFQEISKDSGRPKHQQGKDSLLWLAETPILIRNISIHYGTKGEGPLV